MLIGNTHQLAFDLIPVTPSWRTRYRPEQTAWAGLALWVHGENLCSHRLPGGNEIRDHLFVPLGPLADWIFRALPGLEFEERASLFPTTRWLHEDLARWADQPPPASIDEDDWLDAREDWWSRHFLAAGADGARLPNVALVRDDEQLVVTWRSARFFGEDAPVLLSVEGTGAIPWSSAREVLSEFVARVAQWLRDAGGSDVFSWASLERPLEAAEPPLDSALELFTGRPIAELERLLGATGFGAVLSVLGLADDASDPAASPSCQILRDLSPALDADLGELLTQVEKETEQEAPDALERWMQGRHVALDAARSGARPEQAGQLAANEIRRSNGLNGQPIADIEALLAGFGVRQEITHVRSGSERMLAGSRDDGRPIAAILRTPQTERPWGQRFEAARALGHLLLDPIRAGAVGAASGPFAHSERRRRSGAFAAELLLPYSALKSVSCDRLDGVTQAGAFQRLLDDYNVGATAAAYQLWNRGWLSSADVRDDLIAEYAAV